MRNVPPSPVLELVCCSLSYVHAGLLEIISGYWFVPLPCCFTEATSKAASTPKKKATVQAKLTATGQISSPQKDPLANINPKKFSGFTGKS